MRLLPFCPASLISSALTCFADLLPAGRRLALLSLVLFPIFRAGAQQAPSILGTVITADGVAVELATVTLHRAADSVLVRSDFTDAQGGFVFERAAAGHYLVSAAQVGFNRYWSTSFEVAAGGGLTLPAIRLSANGATTLNEVVITGQKPLFERLADRTVVNVEGSTLATGASSLDVLARAPGVTVDNNDNLALRGKQGLLVLIDGKRQPMTGRALADYLRALPTEQLKTIELITSPPAKYDAQGGAGIIAINLKKDERLGTNGTANASYGRNKYNKYTGGLSLTHRQPRITLSGAYNYTDRESANQLLSTRTFGVPGRPEGRSDLAFELPAHVQSHTYRAGLDFRPTTRTEVGVGLSGVGSRSTSAVTNEASTRDALGQEQGAYTGAGNLQLTRPNVALNLHGRHAFADSANAPALTADLDYACYEQRSRQLLRTAYRLPKAVALLDNRQTGTLTIRSAQADYRRPLPGRRLLEAGLKTSVVASNNDVRALGAVDNVSSVDLNQTNRFRFRENINAAYASLTHTWDKFSVRAGLRIEQTRTEGRQDVGNARFVRSYAQLFPSFSFQVAFNERHTSAIALGRRIDRPSYSQLNPFRSYADVMTFEEGNPALRPQTSYNLELTHIYRQQYSAGLSYSRTRLPITQVVQPVPGGGAVVGSVVNLDVQHHLALNVSVPVQPAKWWSISNDAMLFYSRYQGQAAGTGLNRGRAAYTLNSASSFVLGKEWSAELSGSYQSRQQYGFLDIRPQGQLTAGIQKSLWKKQASLTLTVADLLWTQVFRATSSYDNYQDRLYQRFDSRVVRLTFTYKFGNQKLPTSQQRTGAENEKRRAQ